MISSKLVLNFCFSLLILIMIIWWKLGIIKSYTDYSLGFIAIISSLINLFSKKNFLLDLAHFLYCGLYLVSVIIFSNNKYFLILNTTMLFFIIYSRYYYGRCSLNREKAGNFENLNKNMKLDWNLIFPFLIILSAGKTVVLFENS